MKKAAFIVVIACSLCMCTSQQTQDKSEQKLEDPARMQPPEDAIPDSAAIVNDSLIVTDTSRR